MAQRDLRRRLHCLRDDGVGPRRNIGEAELAFRRHRGSSRFAVGFRQERFVCNQVHGSQERTHVGQPGDASAYRRHWHVLKLKVDTRALLRPAERNRQRLRRHRRPWIEHRRIANRPRFIPTRCHRRREIVRNRVLLTRRLAHLVERASNVTLGHHENLVARRERRDRRRGYRVLARRQPIDAIHAAIVGDVAGHRGRYRRQPALAVHRESVPQRTHGNTRDRLTVRIEQRAGYHGAAEENQRDVARRSIRDGNRRSWTTWSACAVVGCDVPLFRATDRIAAGRKSIKLEPPGIVANSSSRDPFLLVVQEYAGSPQGPRLGAVCRDDARDGGCSNGRLTSALPNRPLRLGDR